MDLNLDSSLSSDDDDGDDECWILSPLHHAVFNDDTTSLQQFIRHGEDINQFVHGLSPLHLACKLGHVDCASMLLNYACAVNDRENAEAELTPLHLACRSGPAKLVQELLAKGADVNLLDFNGATALSYAALQPDSQIIQMLVAGGLYVNAPNFMGLSPLIVATINGQANVAKTLIAVGVSLEHQDVTGCTCLFHAVSEGNLIIADLLLKAGASPNVQTHVGDFPILQAIRKGDDNMLRLLLQANCDINVVNYSAISFSGITPVHLAVIHQRFQALSMLIEAGVDLQQHNLNKYGMTLILEALSPSYYMYDGGIHLDILKLLIQSGCNLETRNKEGQGCLDLAIKKQNLAAMSMLLEADCPVHKHHQFFLLDLQQETTDDPVFYNIKSCIRASLTVPLSLKRQCRRSIKKTLQFGKNYHPRIQQLKLPSIMEGFLTFQEI